MFSTIQALGTVARKKASTGGGGGTVISHPTLAAKISHAYKLISDGTDSESGTTLSTVGTTFGGTTGELNTWAIFDGINDMMFTSTQLLTGSAYAMEIVIEVDTGSTSADRTIFNQTNSNATQFWLDNGSQTDTEFVISEEYTPASGGYDNRKILANGGISETVEYHIIYSRNGTTQTAYINGAAVTLSTLDGTPAATALATANRISLGCFATGSTTGVAFTDGKIKYFRTYNTDLTSGEASDLYNSGGYLPYD